MWNKNGTSTVPAESAPPPDRRDAKDRHLVTATALGLLGPLAFLAAIALNAGLIWRAGPHLARALAGPQPIRIPARIRPDGESNVVPLQPRLTAAAAPRPLAQAA